MITLGKLRSRIMVWVRPLLMSPLERYLSKAVDHADLEYRLKRVQYMEAGAKDY